MFEFQKTLRYSVLEIRCWLFKIIPLNVKRKSISLKSNYGNYKYDLEDWLIQFSVDIILACGKLDGNFVSLHLSKQLIRSTTAVALNYGEAQSAESARDFLHKMKICLKELRESLVNLKIQKGANVIKDIQKQDCLLKENNELIAIFVTSIRTANAKKQ